MKGRYMLLVAALCLALLSVLPASAASTVSGSPPGQAGAGNGSATPVPPAATDAGSTDGSAGPAISGMTDGSAVTQAQASRGFWYTVVRGDTLAKLARRYGTTINAIWRANPRIWNPNRIYTGQRLFIPVARPSPTFTNVKVALIALNTGGNVGCGDSVVLVNRQVPATTAPLTAAIKELLSIKQRDYGQSGLTNILYNSNLQVQKVTVADGHADIWLTGNLSLGGVCDDPRAIAQFEETAKQFSTVQTVSVFVNDELLQDLLSGRGSQQ